MRLLAVLLLGLLCLESTAGCVGGRGHPVRRSLPFLAADEVRTLGMYPLEEPVDPAGDAAVPLVFVRLKGLLGYLQKLRTLAIPDPRTPVLASLPRLEASVARRYAGGGFGGPVRIVGALGVAGRVPIPPGAMAEMMMDATVERQVLAADVFRLLGEEYRTRTAHRRRYRAEFHRIGAALWVYNMRFTFTCERRDLSDGRVLLRYDPRVSPKPEHVTLWRGGCLLEPEGTGSRVSEILILGTDVSLPPFLVGGLRSMVRDKLSDRAKNLWVRAWAGK